MMRSHLMRGAAALALAALTPLALANDADSFFRAIKQDNDISMRNLLASGIDPNTRNEKGVPGLYMALQDGSLKVANLLIESPRLKAEQRNASDESPLMMAALKGQLDMARRLITKGADVNKPGWAPLHYAATGGHLDMMNLLLEEHAFIDAESPNGTTPLMMAASYGTPQAVKLLVEAGADIDMRNQKGMTALDFARRAERPDSVELLAQAARYKAQRPGSSWGSSRAPNPATLPQVIQTTPAPATQPRAVQVPPGATAWPTAPQPKAPPSGLTSSDGTLIRMGD